MKKDKKIGKYITFVLAILQISILLVAGTYAWFADKNTPTIAGNNIKISSAEGLIIKLTPDSVGRTLVNLDEILGDTEEPFALQQMSSQDAINFYTIDFGAGLAFSKPQFFKLEPDEVTGKLKMEDYGCIDYDFYLQTEDQPKTVYFHKDTGLTGSAANAVRVAITLNTGEDYIKYIFGTTRENGITDDFTTHAIIAEGQFNYNSIDPAYVGNQVVYDFSDFNGGRGSSDGDAIDLNKILFSMPANTQYKINVKIWLEGGDTDCTNDISDSVVNALIKFGSANVLREAPTLSPVLATKKITGLTTDMEYSLTNNATSVWTSVTDVNMTFTQNTIYYVRYKANEDEGILESYATTVTFN